MRHRNLRATPEAIILPQASPTTLSKKSTTLSKEDLMGVRARRALVALGVAATAMALIAAVPATGSEPPRV